MTVLAIDLCLPSNSFAGVLEIQISGLDLQYDGTSIFDAAAANVVRAGNPAQADALTALNFYLDGSLVGVQNTNVFADVYIKDVLNIPALGGAVVSGGNGNSFGLDLLTDNLLPGWGLALNVDTMQFFYTGSKISITVAGLATQLADQNLPFGLEVDGSQQITIVLSSASLTGVTTAGSFVTSFKAAGTGNVAGTGMIPEPSSIILGAFGIAALAALSLRRRRLN